SRVAVGQPAGIAAEHEHRAMRQVENAERAVDDCQPRRDQSQQGTEDEPVKALRYEISPADHAPLRAEPGCTRTPGSLRPSAWPPLVTAALPCPGPLTVYPYG